MIDQQQNVYENEMNFVYGILPVADCGLASVSRKRSNETFQHAQFVNQNDTVTFPGQDIFMQINQQQQQQLEIDRFIAHHTEKMKYEIESIERTNSIRLMIAAEEQISKKLRSKDNEIIQISKLNYALEEKVKSLILENQIWKQMAETNETTVNVLRRNLQRIVTEMEQDNQNDDVESCCGSNDVNSYSGNSNGCRNCGEKDSCVLLLPCRHLCVCSVCESLINFCPICKSVKNATIQLNMT